MIFGFNLVLYTDERFQGLNKYFPWFVIVCPRDSPASLQQLLSMYNDNLPPRYSFNPFMGIEAMEVKHHALGQSVKNELGIEPVNVGSQVRLLSQYSP